MPIKMCSDWETCGLLKHCKYKTIEGVTRKCVRIARYIRIKKKTRNNDVWLYSYDTHMLFVCYSCVVLETIVQAGPMVWYVQVVCFRAIIEEKWARKSSTRSMFNSQLCSIHVKMSRPYWHDRLIIRATRLPLWPWGSVTWPPYCLLSCVHP